MIVKLYQRIERISAANPTGAFSQQCSRDQLASALAHGCRPGGYMWLYSTADPRQGIDDAAALAADCGVTLPVLWIDVETYTDGSLPGAAVIEAALDECARLGVRGGIYSGKYIWDRLGNLSLPGVPLWSANYDGNPSLDTPTYGGMTLVGHQWSDKAPDGSGLDRSVFRSDFT